jgi:hypothetical protein
LLQARSANPVNAFLLFLHLLEAYAEFVGKVRLRNIKLDPAQPNALPKFMVVLAGWPLIFEAAVRFLFAVADNIQCGFLCHGFGFSLPLAAGLPNGHIAQVSTYETIGEEGHQGVKCGNSPPKRKLK